MLVHIQKILKGLGIFLPPITKKIVNVSITPDGTIAFWINLSKPLRQNYEKGYIFDIADSPIKNRMSLFIDEYGFLNWKIIDNTFSEYTLKADINEFLDGKRFFIALTWNKDGELTMYINAIIKNKINLENLDFNVKTNEFYIGSDIHGDHRINIDVPKITKRT